MLIGLGLIKFDEQEYTPKFQEEVNKIADSIKEQGLLHPITVRRLNDSEYKIVAGVKRFLAYQKILHDLTKDGGTLEVTGWETIPCEVREDIKDDEKAQEVAIHENLKRANLPWYEECFLVEKLHNLRQTQHGKSKAGRPEDKKTGWGLRDTAEELGRALGGISEDINLAQAVRADPSLRGIKDKRTAARLTKLAARRVVGESEAGVPIRDFATNQVYLGSSADILKRFPDNSFDACISDPPWLVYKDKALTRDDETIPVFKELFRVLKFGSFVYLFVGIDDFISYLDILPRFGFEVSRTPLIWQKVGHLTREMSSWRYNRDFELILLAVKGQPVLTSSIRPSSIFSFKVVPTRNLIHPNEKPIELIKELLEDSTHEGSLIIDPFSGSGSHLHAAQESGRRFIGIERDKRFYDNICRRLGINA